MAISAEFESSLRAKFEAVLPHLDERSARLVLAGEARSLGHGGIAAVARASGASRSRVQDGVAELESGQAPLERVRRVGGGRKPAGEADPGLVPALLALVEPTRRGDPKLALSWTTLSVRKLAVELSAAGHKVSQETVVKLLRAEGFSLQGNTKQIEGGQHPDRDAQFSYLNDQVAGHQEAAEPTISVDTKKKELVGAYKNSGQEWRPADYVNQSGAHCGSLSQLHYEESVGTYRALRSARFRDQLMGVLRPWYLPVEAAFRSTSIIVVEAAGRASPMSRRGPALDSRTAPTAQVGGRRGNCLAGGR